MPSHSALECASTSFAGLQATNSNQQQTVSSLGSTFHDYISSAYSSNDDAANAVISSVQQAACFAANGSLCLQCYNHPAGTQQCSLPSAQSTANIGLASDTGGALLVDYHPTPWTTSPAFGTQGSVVVACSSCWFSGDYVQMSWCYSPLQAAGIFISLGPL